MLKRSNPLLSASVVAIVLAGCAQPGSKPATSTPAATPAASNKTPPGMNASGEVVDASKVEGGTGQQVKGINGVDGEINGKFVPGSKFDQIKIGMGMKQVTDIVGQPTDQGAYVTGKAFIPFYYGGDRHRYELVYKGKGRLIFSGGGFGDYTSGQLIWIINAASESGYR